MYTIYIYIILIIYTKRSLIILYLIMKTLLRHTGECRERRNASGELFYYSGSVKVSLLWDRL